MNIAREGLYVKKKMAGPGRIELPIRGLESLVIPLNYAPAYSLKFYLVECADLAAFFLAVGATAFVDLSAGALVATVD